MPNSSLPMKRTSYSPATWPKWKTTSRAGEGSGMRLVTENPFTVFTSTCTILLCHSKKPGNVCNGIMNSFGSKNKTQNLNYSAFTGQ